MKTSHDEHDIRLRVAQRGSAGAISYSTTLGILDALADHTGPDGKPVLTRRTIRSTETGKTYTYYVSQWHDPDQFPTETTDGEPA